MVLVWTVMMVPSFLWLKNSLLWVIFMSDYALVAAHWSSYQGARAEREAGNGESRADLPGES
jgi:hypothetical protein